MNDRILELARRVVGKHRNDVDSISLFDEQIEKFAELIVRECANLNFRGTGFVTSEGEDMVRSMIKQHFGVEK